MKTLTPFFILFGLLVAAAIWLGNSDPITPAVINARAETSVGVTMMSAVNQGMALFFKWIAGATMAGLAGAAFVEGRKLYRYWWLKQRNGRWSPRPNDQRVSAPTQRFPKLTREDVLLMALAGRDGRIPNVRSIRSPMIEQSQSDELDLDL